MNLRDLYHGVKIIETFENYTKADITNSKDVSISSHSEMYYSDEEFWNTISEEPFSHFGKKISLIQFVVSRWIARVPGLYWAKSSASIRQHSSKDISFQSTDWIEFNPPGKSKKVLGGIGCLLLPPTEDGKLLLSVSSSANSSLGIPILVFPEVVETLKINQGDSVSIINATWQPLSVEWSSKFPTTYNVPRGYLVIDRPEKIRIYQCGFPVVYHPFSIMEYESNNALFYDFVYVTIDSKVINAEKKIRKFFDSYSKKDDRYGKYLINPNLVQPLFDVTYYRPSDFRTPSEKAKLDLLYERVRGTYFKQISLDLLNQRLCIFYQNSTSVKRLCSSIQLNSALLSEDNAASMISQLIMLAINKNKTEDLIDRVLFEYPKIF
jgi:hypothetical protein